MEVPESTFQDIKSHQKSHQLHFSHSAISKFMITSILNFWEHAKSIDRDLILAQGINSRKAAQYHNIREHFPDNQLFGHQPRITEMKILPKMVESKTIFKDSTDKAHKTCIKLKIR